MRSRPIFTTAASAPYDVADQPIHAVDPLTGIRLVYRFDAALGGVLTCYGGPLGAIKTHSQPVDIDALDAVATRLCDELAAPAVARR